ncbi:MAG: nucleotidyltransferase domain-containing protein [archaeon]
MNLKKYRQALRKIDLTGIDDIVIFGSAMKGKDNPSDIDIMIIFKERVNKEIETDFRKALDADADVNSTTVSELESDAFIAKEGIFLEGYSLIRQRLIHDCMGFMGVVFFKYDISQIKGSKRVRFYYALHGRDEKGVLDLYKAKRMSDNVIVSGIEKSEKIREFLEQWGIEYTSIPALVPKRLRTVMF